MTIDAEKLVQRMTTRAIGMIPFKLLDIGAGTNEIRRMLIGRELIGAA